VSEQQMSNLLGAGLHPDAQRLEAAAIAALRHDMPMQERMRLVNRAVRLGQPFRRMAVDNDWHNRLADRYQTWNHEHHLDPRGPVPEAVREMLRTRLVEEMFTEQHGRPPRDIAERTGFLAQVSRPARSAVAGFDVTFSPVKSVSTLWTVAPIEVARQVEAAHHAAVTSTRRIATNPANAIKVPRRIHSVRGYLDLPAGRTLGSRNLLPNRSG
jgi:hypothetical protein